MKILIWTIVAIIIIGGGIWWYESSQINVPATTDTGATPTMNATVVYDGSSFSPSTVTITQGGTVTFTNTSSQQMWVTSDPHPFHEGYDGNPQSVHCAPNYGGPAPFDQCSAGTSFTFLFNKTGTWVYHDHINDPVGGAVIVVP